MLKISSVEKQDMPVSRWSGGTTTEIAIFPEGAAYKERDFIFRVSTAEVEIDESDFTDLPDYDRIIASIDGAMELTHALRGGEKTVIVEPQKTVHEFDGGVPTHCIGRARDLNLMLRKGSAEGGLRFLKNGESVLLPLTPRDYAIVYEFSSGMARIAHADEDDVLVFMAEGPSALFTVRLIG